ncbi:MAG: DUF3084 domain-containing protein [Xenococcaceae cyanobacterium]
MTSAYILVAAIFVIGPIVAILGDRLGTKIGKARFRLFKMRPRQTATIVTGVTGMLISLSTFGILFAFSGSLRQGIFELDDILKQKKQANKELEIVTKERNGVERELLNAKNQQSQVEEQLFKTNKDFQTARNQLKDISSQVNKLRGEIKNLLTERRNLLGQLTRLREQKDQLQVQLRQKEQKISSQDRILAEKEARLWQLQQQRAVLQAEISQRDKTIVKLDRSIANKDYNLKVKESQLTRLESQINLLVKEVSVLERYYETYQELRGKQIAIVKGQVLAYGAVRFLDRSSIRTALDRLLGQANLNVIRATRPGAESASERVVYITNAQVEQIASQIENDREYVIRILSAGNYVLGEKKILVFVDLAPNREIFKIGDVLAAISVENNASDRDEIEKKLDWLFAASKFRAERAGVLGELQLGEGQVSNYLNFMTQLTQSGQSFDEIKAIVSQTTYTSGPLKIRLVALLNGQEVFSTQ